MPEPAARDLAFASLPLERLYASRVDDTLLRDIVGDLRLSSTETAASSDPARSVRFDGPGKQGNEAESLLDVYVARNSTNGNPIVHCVEQKPETKIALGLRRSLLKQVDDPIGQAGPSRPARP